MPRKIPQCRSDARRAQIRRFAPGPCEATRKSCCCFSCTETRKCHLLLATDERSPAGIYVSRTALYDEARFGDFASIRLEPLVRSSYRESAIKLLFAHPPSNVNRPPRSYQAARRPSTVDPEADARLRLPRPCGLCCCCRCWPVCWPSPTGELPTLLPRARPLDAIFRRTLGGVLRFLSQDSFRQICLHPARSWNALPRTGGSSCRRCRLRGMWNSRKSSWHCCISRRTPLRKSTLRPAPVSISVGSRRTARAAWVEGT